LNRRTTVAPSADPKLDAASGAEVSSLRKQMDNERQRRQKAEVSVPFEELLSLFSITQLDAVARAVTEQRLLISPSGWYV